MSVETVEKEAIENVVQKYFTGMYTRNLELLRSVFYPNAKLFGHYEGAFAEVPLEEWLTKVASRPIPAEIGEVFDMRIDSIDRTGQIASVKVFDLYRGLRFTDYLHLLKKDGAWIIVNKLFHHD